MYGATSLLYPYQSEDTERIKASLRRHRRVMYQLATGGGKTTVGMELAGQAAADGRSVVWLCHRRELVAQAVERASDMGLPVHDTYHSGGYPDAAVCVQSIDKAYNDCLLYTSPSPRDRQKSRMPSSA